MIVMMVVVFSIRFLACRYEEGRGGGETEK